MMTKEKLCALLNGREYTKEINEEISYKMQNTGLVAVFGRSDDLMEFRGAINDEFGCYNGGKAFLNRTGLLENHCGDENCPYFGYKKKNAMTIKALWCAEPGISWTYKTGIPHSTFEIVDNGVIYCRGIVFSLADVI